MMFCVIRTELPGIIALRLLSLLIGALALVAPACAHAGETTAQDYGVSPTIPCPASTYPPDQTEAELLIICSGNQDDFGHAKVYRTYNVHLQVAKPRAYAYGDPGGDAIDPEAPVYPIRGMKTTAVCSPVSAYMQNEGKNCSEFDWKGDGICYRTSFGDWKCQLPGTRMASRDQVPPPH